MESHTIDTLLATDLEADIMRNITWCPKGGSWSNIMAPDAMISTEEAHGAGAEGEGNRRGGTGQTFKMDISEAVDSDGDDATTYLME